MAIQIGGSESQEEFDKRFNTLFPSELSYTVDGKTINFKVTKTGLKNGATRVAISNADDRESDPLYFDVRPGEKTGKNQSSVILDYSEKGSKHKRAITNEIFVNSERPVVAKGDITIRNPLEALRDTAFGSFFVDSWSGYSQQSKFNYLASHGSKELRLAGGWQNLSPFLSKSAGQALGKSVTIGYGREVKDTKKALSAVMSWVNPRGTQPTAELADRLQILAGLVPHKDSDGTTRLVETAVSTPRINEADEWVYDELGKVKARNVVRSEREQLTEEGLFKRSPSTGLLMPATPELITNMKAQGLRRLNAQMGGGGMAPAAVVDRNVLMTGGNPFSGAMTTWEEPSLDAQGIIGPYYGTRISIEEHPSGAKPPELADLNRTSYEWGVFKSNRKGGWNRVSDLVGFQMTPKQSIVAGLRTVTDKAGVETVTPIRIKNTNRNTVITDLPTMLLPPAIDDVSGRLAPVAGSIQSSEGNYESREFSEKELQELKRHMGGGYISPTSLTEVSLNIPIAVENARGGKQLATKFSYMMDYGAISEERTPRTLQVGSQRVPVFSVTAAIKNPIVQFLYGQVGTLPTEKIRQLVSDTYGKKSPLLPEIDKTIAYQNDLLNNTALTEAERSKQWRGIDFEKLALIQAEHTKTPIFASSPWAFVNDFRRRVLKKQRENPDYYWNEYQMGLVRKPEYLRTGTIHVSEIDFQRQRLKDATRLVNEENPGLFTKKELEEINDLDSPNSLFKFTPIEGHEDLKQWKVLSSGILGTVATQLVTEHLFKDNPRLSIEQISAINSTFPEGTLEELYKQAKVLETPGNKAWSKMYEYYKSITTNKVDIDNKPLAFNKRDYTEITDEQASEIATRIGETEGNNPALFQKAVDETLGKNRRSAPLLRMKSTGELFPAPKTARGVSELEVLDENSAIAVDRFSKTYPSAFMDWLLGKKGSTPISKFQDTLVNALNATKGNIMKNQQSIPVVGKGGKVGGISGLPAGVMAVSDSDMRRYIIESIKASRVSPLMDSADPNNPYKLNWQQKLLLDEAYEQVKAQGGLPAAVTKNPIYNQTGSVQAAMLQTPEMIRKGGLNMPDSAVTRHGRIGAGSSGLWGLVGRIGSIMERFFGDFDLDPIETIITERWKMENGVIRGTMASQAPYKDIINQSGKQFTKETNAVLQSISGQTQVGNVSAVAKELKDLIIYNRNPDKFIDESKLTTTTQSAGTEAAIIAMETKAQMGVAYNTRRLMQSAMEMNPDLTQEDETKQYDALGLSYEQHLEQSGKLVPRRYEKFFQTLSPVYNKPSGKWGFYFRGAGNASKTTADLDINELGTDYKALVLEDVKRGVLNPHAAMGQFAANSQELQEMESEYHPKNVNDLDSARAEVSRIISEREKTKGYDFSKTTAGQAAAIVTADKLAGISRRGYKLNKKSAIGSGRLALPYLANEDITYNGETTSVSDFIENPRLRASSVIFKALKRKNGVLKLSDIEDLSRGEPTKFLANELLRGVGGEETISAVQQPGVHEKSLINVDETRSYRPTPNELNNILDKSSEYRQETFEKIYAKTQLGLGSIYPYIEHPNEYAPSGEKYADLGNKFERNFREDIIAKEGLESTYSPKNNMILGKTGSLFGWTGGEWRPDIFGIDSKTGKFFIGDFKWKATAAKAEEIEKNPIHTIGQLTQGADVFWRMANPQKYLKNWNEIKKNYGGNPEESYFAEELIKSIETEQSGGLTSDQRKKLEEYSPKYFNAIRNAGTSRFLFTGTGGAITGESMHYRKKSDFGVYTEEEAQKLSIEAAKTMEAIEPRDILSGLKLFSSQIDEAAAVRANVQPLPPAANMKLSAIVNGRNIRQIPKDIPINTGNNQNNSGAASGGSNSNVGNVGNNNDSNNNDNNNIPPIPGGDSNDKDPNRKSMPIAGGLDETNSRLKYIQELFEQAVSGAGYSGSYSGKPLNEVVAESRFGAGKISATSLIQSRDYLKNLPATLIDNLNNMVSARGNRSSVSYIDKANGQRVYRVGNRFASEQKAVDEVLNQLGTLEGGEAAAFSNIINKEMPSVTRIAKDYKKVKAAEASASQLGYTSKDAAEWEQIQLMQTAEQTPNIPLAMSIAQFGRQKNLPGAIDADEERAKGTIEEFKRYKEADVIGNFEKALEKTTGMLDDLIKTGGEYEATNKDGIEITKKLNKAQMEAVEYQKERIEKLSSGQEEKRKASISSTDEALQKYASKELTAEEAVKEGKIGQALSSAKSLASKTKQIQNIEQETEDIKTGNYAGTAPTLDESFRGAFGGFGLFYLRTLFSYGSGSYQKGYEATVKQKTLMNQMQTARYGAENVDPYESEELQKQRNLLISGGNVWTNIQKAGNAFGKNTDVAGSLLSGLGAYAAVNHLTPVAGSIANLFGANLSRSEIGAIGSVAAPVIGGLAAATMFGYSIYSNAVNYNDSIIQAAAGDTIGNDRLSIPSGIKMLGPRIADWWNGNYTSTTKHMTVEGINIPYATNVQLNSDKQLNDLEWERTVAEQGLALRSNYLSKTPEDLANMINVFAAQPPQQLKGLTPEHIAKLMYDYTSGDKNSWRAANDYDFLDQIGDIGRAQASGLDVESMARQTAIMTGLGYQELGDMAYLSDYYADIGKARFAKASLGMNMLNNLPSISRNLNAYGNKETGEVDAEAFEKLLAEYGDVATGPLADALTQRITTSKKAASLGRIIEVKPEDFALESDVKEQNERMIAEDTIINRQLNISETLQQAGINIGRSNAFSQRFTSPEELNFAERLMSYSPTAIGDFAQQLNNKVGGSQLAAYFDKFALTDYNLQGQQTGLGHWATSLRGATSSAVQNANMIWGKGNWEDSELAQAAVYGINRDTGEVYKSEDEIPEGANVVAGQRGIQWKQFYLGIEQQNKQFDIQQRQLGLQEQYQPLFWAQEDKQREFSYRQQEWSFSQQEASMEMQSRHFQQNMAFQQKQAYMQRGWTAEDWGYQDLTRSLQWGWKQEDFAEQSRFMTGRDRKIAERGMERETTLFNLESGQIDKTRDRQKQMWALEDERFAIQKEQYAEQKKFQEDALAKQREFFEEQKQLTEESVTLNRQYQTEQIALQKESLALQMEYAAKQNENNKKLMELSDMEENMQGAFALAKEKQLEFFNMAVGGFEFLGIEFKQMIQSIISGTPYEAGNFAPETNVNPSPGGNVEMPMAKGGDMFPGMAYIVGEAGMERVRPNTLGSVVNQYDIAQTLRQTDRWTNRSVFYPSNQGSTSGSPQTINVYVGNDKLASFVLNTVKSDLEVF